MVRPKQKPPTNDNTSKALVLARAARDSVLRSIKNIEILSQTIEDDSSERSRFEARCTLLDKYVDQFKIHQQEVLAVLVNIDAVNEFETVDIQVTDEMEDLYVNIKATVETLHSTSVNADRTHNVSSKSNSVQTVSLPKIELPKFDGNAIEWCYFRDMFISLVHKNPTITNMERFHYLLSCLSGPALKIVKAIPPIADNYVIAWDALKLSFENKRILVTAHVDKLFAFSPLKKESISALAAFVNTFRENVAAIKALGVDDVAGFLLFYIGVGLLDSETRRLFEASIPQTEMPTLDTLLNFVVHRCKILDNIGTSSYDMHEQTMNSSSKKGKGSRPVKSSLAATTGNKMSKCLYCHYDHQLYRCYNFKRKPVSVRRKFVADNNLCFICMNSGHPANTCSASYLCRTCGGKHSTLLHLESRVTTPGGTHQEPPKHVNKTQSQARRKEDQLPVSATEVSEVLSNFSGALSTDTTVVLGTAIVNIRDDEDHVQQIRILLDSGSQVSAITSDCANRLGLKRSKSRMEVAGLSQQPITKIKGVTQCEFTPRQSKQPTFRTTNVIILDAITSSMPNQALPKTVRERYSHLVLADPEFDVPKAIDMLIGGDLYPAVLQHRADIIHAPGLPSAMHTQLGWVIVGTLQDSVPLPAVTLLTSLVPTMSDLMQRFWSVEEPGEPTTPTTQDQQCEEWFTRTMTRDSTGRFQVGLPFKSVVCSNKTIGSNVQEESPVMLGSS